MIRNIVHENVIHYGADALIIKSAQDIIGKPYCIKVLHEEFPSAEVLADLNNEFIICSQSKCSSIRKAYRKEKYEEHEAIVLEYIEGTDFDKILATEKSSFAKQLHYAIDIASALSDLQKENIFHRRLSPANIIIEHATHKVFFIDMGLSSMGNIYNSKAIVEDNLETIKYFSPEQTGRINRPIDNRADIYSLGVIFYRLFTGALPFESKDGLELIYAHVAKIPVEPFRVNPELPKVVSDIIMKLLEKNAEDRYQSAFGVKHDLENCLHQFSTTGKISPFKIASNDFSGRLFFPARLFGRDKEIKNLHQLFQLCAEGQKRTLFVSGYSGNGKTVLVEEIQKTVTDKHGFFIRGKFDQIPSDTPYSTFVQAFGELVQQLITGEDNYQSGWGKKISDSLDNSGKIISDFIPGLEKLIGKQSGTTELKGIEAQNRFNYEIIRFIKTIAGKDHPLVIFVDDLQWADASSLNLLNTIAKNRDIEYFMLIASFRNNEVDEIHPITRRQNELREENVNYDEIELKDLQFEDVNQLVAAALHTSPEKASFLTDIIYNKTKGNAFYVWQFLKSLYDEGLLKFDFDKGQWHWNAFFR